MQNATCSAPQVTAMFVFMLALILRLFEGYSLFTEPKQKKSTISQFAKIKTLKNTERLNIG